eukprot:scaffold2184_cov76-Amphora_coffeaeformis.AAC.1
MRPLTPPSHMAAEVASAFRSAGVKDMTRSCQVLVGRCVMMRTIGNNNRKTSAEPLKEKASLGTVWRSDWCTTNPNVSVALVG